MRNISEQDFNDKYFLYKNTIYSIAFSYVHNTVDADDVVQDVFMKYLNSNEQFKDNDNEKYWLIRVTINTCKSFIKKAWKQKVNLDDDQIIHTPDKQNTDISLFEIVYNLPQIYKEVIILYYYENLSIIDISKTLKISISAVKKRLERARNIIKEKEKNNE